MVCPQHPQPPDGRNHESHGALAWGPPPERPLWRRCSPGQYWRENSGVSPPELTFVEGKDLTFLPRTGTLPL